VDLKVIGWDRVDWNRLNQDRVAFVSTIMKFRVP
jgi:hypothetical protein